MSITDVKNRLENEISSLSNSNARKRLSMLFDNGVYTEVDRFLKNGENECEVVAGYGEVNGMPVYAYAQSVDVMNGAMGKVQASKIAHIYDLATKTGAPVVAVFDSNGAHLDEGIDALEAYGKLIRAAGNISGVVPQISVVAGPCVGSAAVLASLSDVVIMVKGADFYITAPENKDAVNTSAALVADTDEEALRMATEVLAYLPSNNLSEPMFTEYVNAKGGNAVDSVVDADSFYELWKEKAKTINVGFARIGGVAVGIVACNPKEKDGYFCPCAAKKAARFVRLCDAFSVPVITFVDSLGILVKDTCGTDGGVKAVSTLTSAYSEATTPKISVITGNAFAAAYISFVSEAAGPDLVLAWDNAAIGTVEPMTAVQLLYKDRLAAGEKRCDLEQEYKEVKCSPFNAAALGYVSDIIAAEDTAEKIVSALDILSSKRVSTLSKKHTNIPF